MRADLHCDWLTSDKTSARPGIDEFRKGQTFQCFAAFTANDGAAAYAAAEKLFRETFVPQNGFYAVKNFYGLERCRKSGLPCCALSCENIGFTGGDYKKILALKNDGVIMASLVWNSQNALAFPNVRADGKRESRGLKKAGRAALEALKNLKIMVDISHLSDGGAEEVFKSGAAVVASHSCCDAVCENPRNLTDAQLKKTADAGGVVGVNFYRKFLGGDGGFAAVAAHLKHIIKTAGEDAPSFGSDWDGTPAGGIKIMPRDMPALFCYLRANGFTPRVLDKIFYGNFAKAFARTAE